MLSLPYTLVGIASFALIATSGSVRLEPRANCAKNYKKCDPKGATATEAPAIGTDLSQLYPELVNTVNGAKKLKRDFHDQGDEFASLLEPRAPSANLCCKFSLATYSDASYRMLTLPLGADGTQCLLLQELNLPFCYDNYTTNYFLPGGSTGQIVSGSYTSATGQANLIDGEYTLADGTKGNIYGSQDSPSKPDTATLAIPTQYTASGSGSAIAATALGQVATITTTIPGTTVAPSTVAEETLPPSVSGTTTVVSATTKSASVIPGTTVQPKTSVYTTTLAAPAASGKGKSGAAASKPDMSGAAGFGLLLYMVFGL
ncbi:MAG: hypothetical protein Q9200_001980 [Gallowayella weberi]